MYVHMCMPLNATSSFEPDLPTQKSDVIYICQYECSQIQRQGLVQSANDTLDFLSTFTFTQLLQENFLFKFILKTLSSRSRPSRSQTAISTRFVLIQLARILKNLAKHLKRKTRNLSNCEIFQYILHTIID